MTVVGIAPDYARGVLLVKLLDTGIKRYGVISPSATGDYGAASALDKNTFAWAGDETDNHVGTSDPGYYSI